MQKNRIEVSGYLAAKPAALRYLPSGTPVTTVRMGETYPYVAQGKTEQHTNCNAGAEVTGDKRNDHQRQERNKERSHSVSHSQIGAQPEPRKIPTRRDAEVGRFSDATQTSWGRLG